MRFLPAAIVLFVVPAAAPSAGPPTPPRDVKVAVRDGLAFLAKDALAWKQERNCVSCHHAALPIWALREAGQRGYAVNGPALAELTKWAVESADASSLMRKPPATFPRAKVANQYAVLLALAFEAGNGPSADTRAALKTLLARVKADQTDEGPWQVWPEPGPRPPIFPSAEVTTTLATLALLPDPAGESARGKGLTWLAAQPPEEDAQADAVRLILWRRARRPDGKAQPLVKRILGRQSPDGGWGQTSKMSSDAWATGQALYALAEAGLKPDDAAMRKGQAFLISTQRADGSWPMTSRPGSPSDKGAKNLVPITGAGAAWATLGLVRSSPPAGSAAAR